ncbi:MAG: heparinase II/III family protein [Bacteroidales bacterium]|nr:heparinase II/III family protein [Bacteroidales bacterium]
MNLLNKSVIAALSAVTVLSCTSELTPDLEPEGSVVLRFSSAMPVSKTLWDGRGILWSAGDKIGVTYSKDGVWATKLYTSEALEQGGEVAEFAVPVGAEGVSGKNIRFHALYPSSCISGDFSGAPEVSVTVPSEQTPSAASFDPSADLMVARAVELVSASSSEAIPLMWNRLVAHADITMSLPDLSPGEKILSVTLTADEQAQLVGSCTLDVDKRTLTPDGSFAKANVVSVMADNLVASDGRMRIWVAVLPCQVSSLIVKLHTDQATYTREITSCNLTFKPNVRGVMSIDMTSAVRKNFPDPTKNALINPRLFDVIDIQAGGMTEVRNLYEEGYIYEAAQALLDYYRTRTSVVNPYVNLSSTSYTSSAKNIADQALKENGYRFYVKGYKEGTTAEGKDLYYSFMDESGGINWEFLPVTEAQFKTQKHRHQWIEYQASVYWGTKDEKYVKSFMEVYSDWLDTYPCPVAGQSSYKIAGSHPLYDMWTDLQATSRTNAHLNVLEYYKHSPSFTPEFLSDMLVAFHDCVECMLANKYYEPASNHRLYEVHAIYHAAAMMPEFLRSDAWLSDALTDLAQQMELQFAPDGVQQEMDPSYHISVVNSFYEIYNLACVNQREAELPSGLVEKLRNAALFVRDIVYPDYSIEDFNDTRSVSWTKSVLKKNFIKYAEIFPDEPSFAWMATEHASGTSPDNLISSYQSTGWYMLRSGWEKKDMMMILKNNYNERGWWHCQPDNGTVSLYCNGRRFLPDAGVYTYGGSASDNALRDSFRATSQHNTLTLDGATIADGKMLGTFKKSAQTDVYDMVYTSNQSYGALRHERALFRIKDGFFVVVDFAIGSAQGSVELNWHFCPGNVVFAKGSDSYSCRTDFTDGNNMLFETFCFSGTSLTSDFNAKTGTSYTSNAIGARQQRPCCAVAVQKTANPIRFITVIHPFAESSDLPEISAVFNTASRMTVTVDGKQYVLSL